MHIWPDLGYVAVVLTVGVGACWLAGQQNGRGGRWGIYGIGALFMLVVAFATGWSYFDNVACGRGGGGECDLGGVFGIYWAFIGLVGYGFGVVLNEARLAVWPPKSRK